MHIVFYIPGMPASPALLEAGKSLGGSESAGIYLARAMARRGCKVTVFSNIGPELAGSQEGVLYQPAGPQSQQFPMGEHFMRFAVGIPHDVLIGQRVPDLFAMRPAAKLHLWWTHDLALRRTQPLINAQAWNLDGILAVSEWHRRQVCAVYGAPPERVHVIRNGIDPELYDGVAEPPEAKLAGKRMLYSSRPERGLEHLVGLPGGASEKSAGPCIMELLAERAPELKLLVCGYDNTRPDMAPLYQALIERCKALPNVQWLGPLGKAQLAAVQGGAWLHVYPSTFEEVSCITAMEVQAAGTPIVACPVAALPETLDGAGVAWVPLKEGLVDRAEFARRVARLAGDFRHWDALRATALKKAPQYDWRHSAAALDELIERLFAERTASLGRMARHYLHTSDLGAFERLELADSRETDPIVAGALAEHEACYRFAREDDLAGHYAGYYEYERARGVVYGPETLDGQPRYEEVAALLSGIPAGGLVLDYGCAHGHYTVNLARRFPELRLDGIDLAPSNIETAQAWALAEGLETRVRFLVGDHHAAGGPYDAVLAGEILEHAPEPARLADALLGTLKPGGLFVATVPYGPWEAEGYRAHWPWRAHLHHLEEADLYDLFGHYPAFFLRAIPSGKARRGEALGQYVLAYRKRGATARPAPVPSESAGAIDWKRKGRLQAPRETLSVCMLAMPHGETLARTLRSVRDVADEIIVGIDCGEADHGSRDGRAWEICAEYGARAYGARSPLSVGFDAARNATIERAAGDWILWIDDDEELIWPYNLPAYLRPNPYDAYAVRQTHFALEPAGVIKTDYPCRVFRNRRGFRFFGLVHEHPEIGAVNGGAGRVFLPPDVAIGHNGYLTEEVRRKRFERNLPLMLKDRERNPERTLGKMLWIRDLMQANRFEIEHTGAVSPAMHERAREAIALWRGLLEKRQLQLCVESLGYYSEAVRLTTGAGVEGAVAVAARHFGIGDQGLPQPIQGLFADPADFELFCTALVSERARGLSGNYL